MNIICGYCKNNIYENGTVINSEIGPLLMCSVCRALYYLDVVVNPQTHEFSMQIEAVNLPQEDEYYLIRNSIEPMPLSAYLPKKPEVPQEQPIEPKDLIEVIHASVSPADFLRKVKYYE